MPAAHDYHVFGLLVRSEIPLPELFPAELQAEPDIVISLGAVAPARSSPGVHAVNGTLFLNVPDVARYRVERGSHVQVEPEPDAHDRNVRLFLLGSVLGLLLHQRGLLPLHANAVEIEGAAVAFMGPSGEGKSTLAAWFHDRGFRVLSDDVCVVEFGADGYPKVRPGLTRLRLWREVLDATGRDPAHYERSFIGEGARDKYDVHLTHAGDAGHCLPLAAVYLLQRGEAARIEPMAGVDALEAAYANTYRGSYVGKVGSSHEHWAAAVKLVQKVPMFRAGRRWALNDLDDQSARLLRHVEGVLHEA